MCILYAAFLLQILILPLFYVTYFYKHGTKKTTIQDYSFKALNLYAILSITILPIPMYNIFLAFIFCNEQSPITQNFTCYVGFYYLHAACAMLGCLLLSINTILNCIIYIETNHSSTKPFAAPPSRLNIIKLLFKILIVLYFVLFFNGRFGQYFVWAQFGIACAILTLRVQNTPFYMQSVNTLLIHLESFYIWISFYSVSCMVSLIYSALTHHY